VLLANFNGVTTKGMFTYTITNTTQSLTQKIYLSDCTDDSLLITLFVTYNVTSTTAVNNTFYNFDYYLTQFELVPTAVLVQTAIIRTNFASLYECPPINSWVAGTTYNLLVDGCGLFLANMTACPSRYAQLQLGTTGTSFTHAFPISIAQQPLQGCDASTRLLPAVALTKEGGDNQNPSTDPTSGAFVMIPSVSVLFSAVVVGLFALLKD